MKHQITLVYPNNTYLKIDGDLEIIRQLVKFLDGQVIDYTEDRRHKQGAMESIGTTQLGEVSHFVEYE